MCWIDYDQQVPSVTLEMCKIMSIIRQEGRLPMDIFYQRILMHYSSVGVSQWYILDAYNVKQAYAIYRKATIFMMPENYSVINLKFVQSGQTTR